MAGASIVAALNPRALAALRRRPKFAKPRHLEVFLARWTCVPAVVVHAVGSLNFNPALLHGANLFDEGVAEGLIKQVKSHHPRTVRVSQKVLHYPPDFEVVHFVSR